MPPDQLRSIPPSDEQLLCVFIQHCQAVIGLLYAKNQEDLVQGLRSLGSQVPQVASLRTQVALAGLLTMMVERSRRVIAAVHGQDERVMVSLGRFLEAGLERLDLCRGSPEWTYQAP
jgi:hypothetical protein